MKQEKSKKLRLTMTTLQVLTISLGRDEQKAVKGGTDNSGVGSTAVPVYCKP
ncbi:MAG: hypothetical protein GY940_18085 [bacterium]|nr:hypothetical protein [bacterium]